MNATLEMTTGAKDIHGTLYAAKHCIPRCNLCKQIRAEYSKNRYYTNKPR